MSTYKGAECKSESILDPDYFEAVATFKCPFADFLKRTRKRDLLELATSEALFSDFFEPASLLKRNSLKAFASVERSLLYQSDAFRNCHALDAAPAEPVALDLLSALWNGNLTELPQVPEKSVADHRSRWQYHNVIVYVPPDVENTVLVQPNHFETTTI